MKGEIIGNKPKKFSFALTRTDKNFLLDKWTKGNNAIPYSEAYKKLEEFIERQKELIKKLRNQNKPEQKIQENFEMEFSKLCSTD